MMKKYNLGFNMNESKVKFKKKNFLKKERDKVKQSKVTYKIKK